MQGAEIIWVKTPANLSTADVDRILAELEQYLRRGRPYYLLFDLGTTLPDAMQRRRLTDHMSKHDEAIQRCVRGLGVVVPSPLARNVMTAILWFAPPKVPHSLFATRAEAQSWAEALRDGQSQVA